MNIYFLGALHQTVATNVSVGDSPDVVTTRPKASRSKSKFFGEELFGVLKVLPDNVTKILFKKKK